MSILKFSCIAIAIVSLLLFCSACSRNGSTVNSSQEENQSVANQLDPEYPKPLLKPRLSEEFFLEIRVLDIILLDSCEYIIGRDNGSHNGGFFLTHRARCKFCTSRAQTFSGVNMDQK